MDHQNHAEELRLLFAMELFSQLTAEEQQRIIAEIKAILSER